MSVDTRDMKIVHRAFRRELLWPPLLSRVDPGADVILRMRAQHERVESSAPVRAIWHVIGSPRYTRRIRRVRAA